MPKDMLLSDELERCRPWIEAALEYCGGTHEFEDIVDNKQIQQEADAIIDFSETNPFSEGGL